MSRPQREEPSLLAGLGVALFFVIGVALIAGAIAIRCAAVYFAALAVWYVRTDPDSALRYALICGGLALFWLAFPGGLGRGKESEGRP